MFQWPCKAKANARILLSDISNGKSACNFAKSLHKTWIIFSFRKKHMELWIVIFFTSHTWLTTRNVISFSFVLTAPLFNHQHFIVSKHFLIFYWIVLLARRNFFAVRFSVGGECMSFTRHKYLKSKTKYTQIFAADENEVDEEKLCVRYAPMTGRMQRTEINEPRKIIHIYRKLSVKWFRYLVWNETKLMGCNRFAEWNEVCRKKSLTVMIHD